LTSASTMISLRPVATTLPMKNTQQRRRTLLDYWKLASAAHHKFEYRYAEHGGEFVSTISRSQLPYSWKKTNTIKLKKKTFTKIEGSCWDFFESEVPSKLLWTTAEQLLTSQTGHMGIFHTNCCCFCCSTRLGAMVWGGVEVVSTNFRNSRHMSQPEHVLCICIINRIFFITRILTCIS
jgi:hypothetical protein